MKLTSATLIRTANYFRLNLKYNGIFGASCSGINYSLIPIQAFIGNTEEAAKVLRPLFSRFALAKRKRLPTYAISWFLLGQNTTQKEQDIANMLRGKVTKSMYFVAKPFVSKSYKLQSITLAGHLLLNRIFLFPYKLF